ncbi:cytochrome P450 [Nocardia sp. NPDC101769]|uniref:cytochrome P450 n=1 Tax=Nocardia sp. NPDC101769 TaxID=3364333 RepID=UPI00382FF809
MVDLHRKYGGVSRFRVGPYLMHQVSDPVLVQSILHDKKGRFVRGTFYRGFELFFGKGLLTADGADWRMRRDATAPYYRAAELKSAIPEITACIEKLARNWEAVADTGKPIDIVPDLMGLAMDVVSRVILGSGIDGRRDDLVEAVRIALPAMVPGDLAQHVPTWLPLPYLRRVRKARKAIVDALRAIMSDHRQGDGDPDSMGASLFGLTDPESGRPWHHEQILDEYRSHFLAGHETTGCGLAWTLYELGRNPAIRARLRTELDDVLGGAAPTADDVDRLPYLQQVVKESLRLYPPIPMFPREPAADVEAGGFRIGKGTTIFISPYAVHHNPEHWPDPDTFDPDRFAAERTAQRYSYLPFGGGSRRCVGARLAELEIQLTVAVLTQRFDLSVVPGTAVEPHAMVSLRPREGVMMTVTARTGVRHE